MLHLYEHPLSPFAQKVKIALYEKGLPFETSMPDMFGSPEERFVTSSPRREVPSLIDGEVSIFDSTIILEYLEDKWPAPPLLSRDPAERARARMIEEICDTYFEAINWGLAEIRVFGRAKGELADTMTARAGRQIAGMHAWLARQLGPRSYFNGDAFGWADLSVQPYLATAALNGFPPPAESALVAWLARVAERPSVQKCAAAALEALSGFANLGPIVESGVFLREYRDHRLEWMMRSGGSQIVLDGMARTNIRFAIELE
jgi:glutathione S-transferase/RNA polymerase-associated protein